MVVYTAQPAGSQAVDTLRLGTIKLPLGDSMKLLSKYPISCSVAHAVDMHTHLHCITGSKLLNYYCIT